jgi:hypothetical protein
MRLSHVVEQLRQRAAMDVRTGKEDSARLLLTEKQKVMKALEAARQRAELFEQLAGKLNVVSSYSLYSDLLLMRFMVCKCSRLRIARSWAKGRLKAFRRGSVLKLIPFSDLGRELNTLLAIT